MKLIYVRPIRQLFGFKPNNAATLKPPNSQTIEAINTSINPCSPPIFQTQQFHWLTSDI